MSDYNDMWRVSSQNFQSIHILKVIQKALLLKWPITCFPRLISGCGLRSELRPPLQRRLQKGSLICYPL